jgi:glycosyltransferase involved in cell wall biosynthesis
MKKKVVLMIPQLKYGGAERAVSKLSNFEMEKFEFIVVCFDETSRTYDFSCPIYSLSSNPNINNSLIKRLYNIIYRIVKYWNFKRRNCISITYSFGDSANIVNVFCPGKDKKIVSIRGYRRLGEEKSVFNVLVLRPLTSLVYLKSDRIISVSKMISLKLESSYGIDKKKIITLYNAYDNGQIEKFAKESIPEFACKSFSGTGKIIISAGTFRSEKGYWHLVKAFSMILKSFPDTRLIILGSDYCGYQNKVKKLAIELGCIQKIVFPGYVNNPYSFFSLSTLYVLSSTFEGFPNAMVEAMICGLPIVASDCRSGPREILAPNTDVEYSTNSIEEAEYGVLVPKMNSVENWDVKFFEDDDLFLGNAILRFFNDENLIQYYSRKSRERACQFSLKNWKEKHDDLFVSVLN